MSTKPPHQASSLLSQSADLTRRNSSCAAWRIALHAHRELLEIRVQERLRDSAMAESVHKCHETGERRNLW